MNVAQAEFDQVLKKHGLKEGSTLDKVVGDFKRSLMLLELGNKVNVQLEMANTILKIQLLAASAKNDKLQSLRTSANPN